MNTLAASTLSAEAKSRMLQNRGEPVFLAGWRDTVFLHFAVPAEKLQPFVPFELELFDGMAYVSCVAFTLRNMRPRIGGAWLMKPIATHEFLNVRTYVRHGGESGIYFLAEWLPNKLSVLLGPTVFGLPYRLGKLSYDHAEPIAMRGFVKDSVSQATLAYTANVTARAITENAERGSLNEFLLERYSAFTSWLGFKRLFRVWHPPWHASELSVKLHDISLLKRTGAWADHASFVSAHSALGFDEVWMGRPHFCSQSAQPQPLNIP